MAESQHGRTAAIRAIAYVHGELFGVDGVKTMPDNPRGERSKSIENRCKGKGEWNVYDVVAVDGVIKLAVNGKFVNGISSGLSEEGVSLPRVGRRGDPLPQHPDHGAAARHGDARANSASRQLGVLTARPVIAGLRRKSVAKNDSYFQVTV